MIRYLPAFTCLLLVMLVPTDARAAPPTLERLGQFQTPQVPVGLLRLVDRGRVLAVGEEDGTLRLIRVADGDLLFATKAHDEPFAWLDVRWDERRAVTASVSRRIRLWNLDTGEQLAEHVHPGKIHRVMLMDDDEHFLTHDYQGVQIRSIKTAEIVRQIGPQDGSVHDMGINRDATRLLTTDRLRVVRLWDMNDGEHLQQFAGQSWPSSPVFVNQGRIAAAGWDHTARIWDAHSGRELHRLTSPERGVYHVQISPSGTYLAATDHAAVRLWNADTGTLLHTLDGHTHWVVSRMFSEDETQLTTLCQDGWLITWDIATGQAVTRQRIAGHLHGLTSFAVNHDATFALTGGSDDFALLWHLERGRIQMTLPMKQGPVRAVAWMTRPQRAVVIGDEGRVHVWQVNRIESKQGTGESQTELPSRQDDVVFDAVLQTEFDADHGSVVVSLAAEPHGRWLATAGDGSDGGRHAVHVHDPTTGALRRRLHGHNAPVTAMLATVDGMLLSADAEGRICLWQPDTGERQATFQQALSVSRLAADPVSPLIAIGTEAGSVYLIDRTTGDRLRTMPAHADRITCLTFSPDGQLLITGSRDRTVRVWNVANGQQVAHRDDFRAGVQGLAVLPDVNRVVATDFNGVTTLFALPQSNRAP